MPRLLDKYLNTFPNIEKYYENNGGKRFVEQLFIDKSLWLKRLPRWISSDVLYPFYLLIEPLISMTIISWQLLKVIIIWGTKGKNDFDVTKICRLYLNYAHLLIERCKSANLFIESEYWLRQPFTGVPVKGLEEKKIISVYDTLNASDIIRAYFHSLLAAFYVAYHNPKHYIRRSYTSFEFYLTYFAISKIPVDTELFFANHIDRWAILFDACPQKKKTLVQHGIETKTANWPVKLKTVTTLYAFNEELGHDVAKALLTHEPEYKYMKPTITLFDDEKDKNYKVLIVCHPAAMRDKEEYLISHLQQPNITVYAKTHYTTTDLSFYEDLAKRYNYHLITTQIFPRVNTLISYRSTLVSEYEICGVPTLMYSDYKSLDEIVDKVMLNATAYEQ